MQAARRAKAAGSTRFCMGAAWRGPSQVGKGQWQRVLGMVAEIRAMDMEVCTTLGMLTPEQARPEGLVSLCLTVPQQVRAVEGGRLCTMLGMLTPERARPEECCHLVIS